MSRPDAKLKIGADFKLTARNVKDAVTGDFLDTAVVSWELLDTGGDAVSGASGSLTLYDAPTASFQGVIGRAITELLTKKAEYVVKVTVAYDGLEEWFEMRVVATPAHLY